MTGDRMIPAPPSDAPHAGKRRRIGREVRGDRRPYPAAAALTYRAGECAEVGAVALEKYVPHDFAVLTIKQAVVMHSPQRLDQRGIRLIDQMARGTLEGTARIGMTNPPCEVLRHGRCGFARREHRAREARNKRSRRKTAQFG